MEKIGRKLRKIRIQRRLSLRAVERLTEMIAKALHDPSRKVSASWLGRFEREEHTISHGKLKSLEEVYGIMHEELFSEAPPKDNFLLSLHLEFPDVPQTILNWFSGQNGPLLPPDNWLAYFPKTTLLPARPASGSNGNASYLRESQQLIGILGAEDYTLMPIARPGAILQIDGSVRAIRQPRTFRSVFERPIYFLRSHDGYHCGWCDLDANEEWLTLISSTMTTGRLLSWRYRQDVEVVGLVTHVFTRLGNVGSAAEEANGASKNTSAREKVLTKASVPLLDTDQPGPEKAPEPQ
jgi:transcriptional regulator with XRE-family HTH domain